MQILGTIIYDKDEKVPYYIGIEDLKIYTQGYTLENAYFMIKNAVSLMISHKYNIDFKSDLLEIIPVNLNTFYLKSDHPEYISYLAFVNEG